MQFSLKSLWVTLSLVAVSCAALRYPNDLLASLFTTIAFAVVMLAVLVMLLRKDIARPYWIGFLVLGGGYFLFANFGERDFDPTLRALMMGGGPGLPRPFANPHLVTTRLLLWGDQYMQLLRTRTTPAGAVSSMGGARFIGDQSTESFVAIGQAIFTLVFAVIGGRLGSWIVRRHRHEQGQPTEPSGT